MIIGHNDRIAWGFTNLTTDVTDLYLEKVDGDEYWRDGLLVPLEQRTETIKVAGGDDVPLVIRSTGHGPIISGLTDDFTAIAEPYTGTGDFAEPITSPQGEYDVALEWTAPSPAPRRNPSSPSTAGLRRLPRCGPVRRTRTEPHLCRRRREHRLSDARKARSAAPATADAQPGWDSAYDWQGFIPFESLPVVLNPDGYIVTANNAIVTEDYPYALTRDWDYGWRAARIVDLLERKIEGPLTEHDMREIQADNCFQMGMIECRLRRSVDGRRASMPRHPPVPDIPGAHHPPDAAAFANVLWTSLCRTSCPRP